MTNSALKLRAIKCILSNYTKQNVTPSAVVNKTTLFSNPQLRNDCDLIKSSKVSLTEHKLFSVDKLSLPTGQLHQV